MFAVCKLQTNIFSLAAAVFVVFCCLCSAGAAANDETMRPLVRAPRATRVESDYFVHMKEHVSYEGMMNFTEKLELEADERNFTVRIGGFAYHAAHGFTAHLSEAALEKVRCCYYYDPVNSCCGWQRLSQLRICCVNAVGFSANCLLVSVQLWRR